MIDKYYYQERRQMRREAAQKFLGSVCAHCGSDTELQFDHIDPGTKEFHVSEGLLRAEKVFWDEVKKCQLLCVKCHQLKSVYDRGHKPSVHGSFSMYRHGKCRCALCKAANAASSRKYKKIYKERRKSIKTP